MRLVLLLAAACLFAGCFQAIPGLWNIPPSGAQPSLGYTNVTYPNIQQGSGLRRIPYDPAAIEIVGWFERGRGSKSLSGRAPAAGRNANLVGIDKSNYADTFHALLLENDLDGLLNVTVDTERWDLNLYLFRIFDQQTKVGGLGYRFKDPNLRKLSAARLAAFEARRKEAAKKGKPEPNKEPSPP